MVESVMQAAEMHKGSYEMWQNAADAGMRRAHDARENASEQREKLEQCLNFLDDNVPEWRAALPKERRWAIFGKTAEEAAEEERARMEDERLARGPHTAEHPDGDHRAIGAAVLDTEGA